ncbi:MAG: FlgD immunoglobulin-like domain containing protein [Candidatus Krumholzibacteriia bacterium]
MNAAGVPVAAGSLAVRIYDSATGGTMIYDSGADFAGAIATGLFDVVLGAVTPLSLDVEQLYHLEIEVDGIEVAGDAAGGRIAFYPGLGSHARPDLEARLSALEIALLGKSAATGPSLANDAVATAPAVIASGAARFGGAGADYALELALLGSGLARGAIDGHEVAGHLIWYPVGTYAAGDRRIFLGPYYTTSVQGTIVLDPSPDPLVASWMISGPGGNVEGAGDATLAGSEAGTYLVTWGTIAGWSPQPASESLALPPLGTVTFQTTYELQPARIDSIVDVPADQGGWVRIHFTRCGLDMSRGSWPDTAVVGYNVHRRVEDPALVASVLDVTGGTGPGLFVLGDRRYAVRAEKAESEMPPGVWEVVQTVYARQQETYLALAPTLADSVAGEPPFRTHYFVSAHTTEPAIFFDGAPDSGYSTDDLAPAVPTGLLVTYATAGNALNWDPPTEPDFQYHRIYRGPTADFVPGPESLVHETTGNQWTDPQGDWSHHYRVSTLDHAGNESDATSPVTASSADVALPTELRLVQNHPNPFNPSTTIRFDLPRTGSVDLRIYDVSGRLVRRLISGDRLPPGRRAALWDGRDDAGHNVATGVYFCRLQVGSFRQSIRMALVK